MAKPTKKKRAGVKVISGGLPATEFRWLLQAVVIIAAVTIIFWPVRHGDWLWDDATDITANPVTQSANGLWSIWFEPGSQLDYYPVKASVQWAQWHLWGQDTLGYHVTNVFLHIVNALLVWRLFHRLGLKRAWLGGLIFAVHPALVESVAWIAELKNTLSTPFFLLAAIFYLDYDERGSRRAYLAALGLFVLAMLTKPTMVMFPFVLLLHAWWKRGRVGRNDLKASAPFFAVSLVLGLMTLALAYGPKHLLYHLKPGSIPLGGFFSRVALVGLSLAFYFGKVVWPAGLLPIYPQWPVNPPSLLQFLPWPVLGGFLYWFWTRRQSWGRHALFGVGFFLVMLVPFCGVTPANFMNVTWVMDHFLYLPILGLIGLVIAGLEQAERWSSPPVRRAGVGLLGVILVAMIVESRAYAKQFVSEKALWSYTLAHDPDAWLAHNNLGIVFYKKGRLDAAISQYQQAVKGNPNYGVAYNNLGLALLREGRLDEAITQYQEALEINPNFADVHNNLGMALAQKGRVDEAMTQFQAALDLDSTLVDAHNNLGFALDQKGRMDEAITQFQEALKIDPNDVHAHADLGIALAGQGRLDEAMTQFQMALDINPNLPGVHYDLGVALMQKGRADDAIDQFEEALQLNPNFKEALDSLAQAQAMARQGTGRK